MKTDRKSSKENTSNLFNRYVWLVDTIFRSGKITFEEINNKWLDSSLNNDGDNLPLKTFHNHRNAVQQMFDVNIECDRRAGYVYYIENSDDMERGGVRSWLLNTFAINNLINESHKMKHRIIFEHIPSGQQFLPSIIEAMRDNLTFEMTYKSFGREQAKTFEVEPYCVKVFKQRWYLVAKSVHYDHLRIYALDRISSMNETLNSFTIPEEFNAEEYFYECYGIINDENIEGQFIKIKVDSFQAKYFKALPLHHSQEEIEQTLEYSVFQYYLKPTFDFRQELLSKGAEVIILSPQWFRDEVSNISKVMCNNYK